MGIVLYTKCFSNVLSIAFPTDHPPTLLINCSRRDVISAREWLWRDRCFCHNPDNGPAAGDITVSSCHTDSQYNKLYHHIMGLIVANGKWQNVIIISGLFSSDKSIIITNITS